jgi:Fe(II)/alpha-ketoglutarate-dependent arginine beta-hydroxylase
VERLRLDPTDLATVNDLVGSIMARFDEVAEPFLREAPLLAHRLPLRVREFINRLRYEEIPVGVITGHVVDDAAIGPTPSHWTARQIPSPTLSQEITAVLYASLLGDVFGWATQQNGHLIHEVFPIRGYEQEQVGFSSETPLTWHTEDAFHPLRGDYLLLACLRNPIGASTTIASIDGVDLDPASIEVLFQPRFTILPDESHQLKNNTGKTSALFEGIERMNQRPEPVAALFGDPKAPYMRLDPYYMTVLDADDEAAEALDTMVKAIDEQMTDTVLQAGDVLILDNYRVVHGRKPFSAKFDGADRWLKRLNVTRDLRKSRAARADVRSRIVT